ncbi:DUF2793 domain-containing protein [Alkalicaulis satelles]|uniref:DUF2793 domain-containing protein n=1 Tax=Alkalicaulis satelles TaxID=2609175 RepID=A0A5M6ZLW6_9PROT|nr:DUF2793 domain-containing protein [Alkalicaulis satelles]KAA5804677.1 DUF2793 domain-containing protein [Alkalicaulis satelles]
MSDATPRLGLPWLMPAQAQKHVTVNETLSRLDALVQARALSASVTAQPSGPQDGDCYILPDGAGGEAWDAFAPGALAWFQDGVWEAVAPRAGLVAFVEDDGALKVHDGTAWRDAGALIAILSNLQRLGVGTEPDDVNRFAAKLNTALWTALTEGEGGTGDLRYTLNKEGPEHVLSLLFQSGWSGRAELGLTGTDDVSLRVSPDGSEWFEALRVERATGAAHMGALSLEALNGGQLAGLRNQVINGRFDVWQRGPSAYPDMWRQLSSGGGSVSASREDHPSGQSDVPGGGAHFLRWSVAGSPSSAPAIATRIEDARTLSGGQAALSFYVRSDAERTLQVRLIQNFGSGGSPGVHLADQVVACDGDWRRVVLVFSLPSVAGKTIGPGSFLEVRVTGAAEALSCDFDLIQLEAGPLASLFEHRPIALERQLCLRYFERLEALHAYGCFALGYSVNASQSRTLLTHHPKRATPSYSASGGFEFLPSLLGDIDSLSFSRPATGRVELVAHVTGGSASSGLCAMLRAANDETVHIDISAEL